ncbi:MAG TPA: hypothetical protein VMP03_07935 [Methylomirabilota bacterium]|nr:hypothetical protein [Methylomirabilota bacterium]
MLFNSYTFIALFLPPTLLGFHLLVSAGKTNAALAWLTLASFAFYAWWEPWHLPLLAGTIVFNYFVGERLRRGEGTASTGGRLLLGLGVAVATMVLGGFWHGAAWTFLIWGALHGVYLVIHHAWSAARTRLGLDCRDDGFIAVFAGRSLTLVAVMVGWVFFRAPSVESAIDVLQAMAFVNGPGDGLRVLAIAGLFVPLVWLMPNSQEIIDGLRPTRFGIRLRWRPAPV